MQSKYNKTISQCNEYIYSTLDYSNLVFIAGIRMWRQLWMLAFGTSFSDDDFFAPFSASLVYLAFVMGLGIILRILNKMISPEAFKEYIADFLATMEMCAYFFENNFIFKHYGSFWLFIAVLVECFIANRTYFGASENPVKAFYQFCNKEIGLSTAVVKIAVQTLAGLASYRLAKLVWSLDLVPDHRERFYEAECASDLNVALTAGILVEFGATLIDTWLGMQVLMKNQLADEIIKLSNGSLMIVLGKTVFHQCKMYSQVYISMTPEDGKWNLLRYELRLDNITKPNHQ